MNDRLSLLLGNFYLQLKRREKLALKKPIEIVEIKNVSIFEKVYKTCASAYLNNKFQIIFPFYI